MKKIKYGVIGCGGRTTGLSRIIAGIDPVNIKLKGGYDPEAKHIEGLLKAGGSEEKFIYSSYKELVNDSEIDWVLIGSPNVYHKEQCIAALNAGKNVFLEKPMATNIKDCVAVVEAHRKSKKLLMTGFVLRYSPIYKKAKEILNSGEIGKIISIDGNENVAPDHGNYIMTNWRRFKNLSGPHILEKCCHDLDIINWFAGSVPVKVAGFSGNNMFVKENTGIFDRYGKDVFKNWDAENTLNPFTTEKTIEDNVVAIVEYKNGIRMQFQATTCNAIPERRMYISGTEGNMVIELYTGSLKYKKLGQAKEIMPDISSLDLHGGGDTVIMRSLVDSMINGTEPACSSKEGLLSAILGLAIDKSAQEGKIVDLKSLWKKLRE